MANGDVVFFGTAAIGLPIVRELNKGSRLRLVVTQPDRRGGRNRQLLVPAIKQFAQENRLPLLQPPDLREPELELAMRRIAPDIAVVVAYGQFIPRDIRSLPRWRTINVHFSLLPAYRGAAPVQRAIQNGESRSGITIFELSGRMDAGPVWAREEVAIRPDDTSAAYQQRLGERAAPFLRQTMEQIFAGTIQPAPPGRVPGQPGPGHRKKGRPGQLGAAGPQAVRHAAGVHPLAGAVLPSRGASRSRSWAPPFPSRRTRPVPGDILAVTPQGLQVACGLGTVLEITAIQPEGKKAMSPWQFSLGHRFPARLS